MITLELSPQSVTLAQGQSQQFIATVSGSDNKNVTWTASGGTVSGSGPTVLYTAPGTTGSFTLTATSQADPSKSASATITVQAVGVSISPARADLAPGGTQRFTAEVVGATDGTVSWTASGGSISGSGLEVLYTAPDEAGEYQLTATSNADASSKATALIVVRVPNQAPAAAFEMSPEGGVAPLLVRFDATASQDADGEIAAYRWDFGDGGTAEGAHVSHSYEAAGSYQVTLTVADDRGLTDAASRTVEVAEPSQAPGYEAFEQTAELTTTAPSRREYRQWVGVDGDTALVGIPNDPADASYPGRVDVYEVQTAGWRQVGTLSAGGAQYRKFGRAVAISGEHAAVVSEHLLEGVPDAEALVHVFERSADGQWQEVKRLFEGAGIPLSHISNSIALAGATLAVGAQGEVYLYEEDEGGTNNWGLVKTLTPDDPYYNISFGSDVGLSEDGNSLIVAGAYDDPDTNSVHTSLRVFERHHGGTDNWGRVKMLTPEDGIPSHSLFVDIDGDTFVVSSIPSPISNHTEVVFYQRNEGGPDNWGRRASRTIHAPLPDGAENASVSFSSVALRGDIAVAGIASYACFGPHGGDPPCTPGRVYVFYRDQGGENNWGLAQTPMPDPAYEEQGFGTALDISADTHAIIVGTNPRPTGGNPPAPASAFIFQR